MSYFREVFSAALRFYVSSAVRLCHHGCVAARTHMFGRLVVERTVDAASRRDALLVRLQVAARSLAV